MVRQTVSLENRPKPLLAAGKKKRARWRFVLIVSVLLLGVLVYPRLLGTLILRAVAHGNASQVRVLLAIGAKPDSFGWYIPIDQTPLMLAASRGSLPTVRLLLEHGADVNTQVNEWSQTPLMCAVERGNPAVVQLLIAKGAHLDETNGNGDSALSLARDNHNAPILRMLKAAGAKELPKP